VQVQPLVDSSVTPTAIITENRSANGAWLRYALFCLPGGAGQFYNRRPIRAGLLLALQAAGVAGTFIALQKRDAVWDPRYGRGDFNRGDWERYSNLAKTGFSLTLSIYTVGVADCIIDDWKKRHGPH
jgi:TM2 domain-containing membrane protein YozV